MTRKRHLLQHGAQVMRMQQIMTASMLAAAAIWGVYFWPTSPWQATVGSIVWLFGYAIVLAIEFGAQVMVNQSDPAPRASWKDVFGAWWAESCMVLRIFCWRQPFKANEVPDQLQGVNLHGQRGVVFIHGLMCNRGFWTPWMKCLQLKGVDKKGHAFAAVSLEPMIGSLDDRIDQIEKAVWAVTHASGLAPVLVCHSMGGLAARAWLRRQTDKGKVHRVVTIGTPHHGTWLARFSHGPSGRQMRQGSAWLQQLNGHPQDSVTEESLAASRVDGAERFMCWYSNCDNIVFPASTATLQGADNRFVRGAAHVQMAFLPAVMKASLDTLKKPPLTN